MVKWKEYLLQLAQKDQMCAPYYNALIGCETKGEAIKLYKRCVDWALESNYPPLTTLRKEFSQSEEDGIYVDKVFDGELFSRQQCYVFHHCSGRILVDWDVKGKTIPMLYVANGCDLTLEVAESNIKVPITISVAVYGKSRVITKNDNRVSFRVKYLDTK